MSEEGDTINRSLNSTEEKRKLFATFARDWSFQERILRSVFLQWPVHPGLIRGFTDALTNNVGVWTGCLIVIVFSTRRTLLVLAGFVFLFTDYWLTDPRLKRHDWSKPGVFKVFQAKDPQTDGDV